MSRVKTVYRNSSEVAHVWANFRKGEYRAIRNASTGNIYTSGATIYSYGSHFPIAQHWYDKQGKHYILLTTRSYSSTTAGHISDVRRAIPPTAHVINCDNVDISVGTADWTKEENNRKHTANLRRYAESISKLQGKLTRARQNKGWYASQIEATLADAKAYCQLFKLRRKFDNVESFLAANANAIEKERKAKEAKEREERKKKEEHYAAALPHYLTMRAMWIAGDNSANIRSYASIHLGSCYLDEWQYSTPTALRLRPNDSSIVETSLGASFPAKHCERVYRFWKGLRDRGETYSREIGPEFPRIGDFQIDRIESDGTIVAGCHRITASEIERFASVLGLNTAPIGWETVETSV